MNMNHMTDNPEMPRIEEWSDGVTTSWHICDAEGVTAAIFHNRHFLQAVLQTTFKLGPFEAIPVCSVNGHDLIREAAATA